MSLTDELKNIDLKHFEDAARRIVGEHDFSVQALTTICAAHREGYPVYDLLCKKIENNGKPLLEETFISGIGMELMLRTLIVIGEENNN